MNHWCVYLQKYVFITFILSQLYWEKNVKLKEAFLRAQLMKKIAIGTSKHFHTEINSKVFHYRQVKYISLLTKITKDNEPISNVVIGLLFFNIPKSATVYLSSDSRRGGCFLLSPRKLKQRLNNNVMEILWMLWMSLQICKNWNEIFMYVIPRLLIIDTVMMMYTISLLLDLITKPSYQLKNFGT